MHARAASSAAMAGRQVRWWSAGSCRQPCGTACSISTELNSCLFTWAGSLQLRVLVQHDLQQGGMRTLFVDYVAAATNHVGCQQPLYHPQAMHPPTHPPNHFLPGIQSWCAS